MHTHKQISTLDTGELWIRGGLFQCQHAGVDIVLQLCKMSPLGETWQMEQDMGTLSISSYTCIWVYNNLNEKFQLQEQSANKNISNW